MEHCTQLAREERYQIHALMQAGHAQAEIAGLLGRHRSTISREIRRNRGGKGWRPGPAEGRGPPPGQGPRAHHAGRLATVDSL